MGEKINGSWSGNIFADRYGFENLDFFLQEESKAVELREENLRKTLNQALVTQEQNFEKMKLKNCEEELEKVKKELIDLKDQAEIQSLLNKKITLEARKQLTDQKDEMAAKGTYPLKKIHLAKKIPNFSKFSQRLSVQFFYL